MDERLKKQLEALTRKAKQTKEKVPSSVQRSSLHKIIKTKKQAETFMKLLKSA